MELGRGKYREEGCVVFKGPKGLVIIGLGLVVALSMAFAGCGKKTNPLAPGHGLPDEYVTTPTPVPSNPGLATVVVKTLAGTTPLTDVSCEVLFAGQASPSSGKTGVDGTATLVVDAEGSLVATLPAQGDLLATTITGYCQRGKTAYMIFQAGGAWTSITPTAINYDFSGGTWPIKIRFSKQANAMNFKFYPAAVNLPSGWAASFSAPVMYLDQEYIMNLTVPENQNLNVNNLMVSANAALNKISVNSSPISVIQGWSDWANVKVVVKNGGVDYNNINFVITDSQGNTYTGTSQPGGRTITINATGYYSVSIPPQGLVKLNTKSGSIVYGELQTVSFDVGSCSVTINTIHNVTKYIGLQVNITDANGNLQSGSTNVNGDCLFNLTSIGTYTARILENTANGILLSTKTGTVGQYDSTTCAFVGQNGSLSVANGNYDYIYNASSHQATVTYTNAGDINYSINLQANGFGGSGVVTSFDNAVIDESASRILTMFVPENTTWTSDTLNVSGSKGGTMIPFAVPASNNFYLHKGYSLSVSIGNTYGLTQIPGTNNYYGLFPMNVNAVGINPGTTVRYGWNMDKIHNTAGVYQSVNWAPPIKNYNLTFTIGDALSTSITGYNRSIFVPVKTDGWMMIQLYLGSMTPNAQVFNLTY